MRVLIYQSMPNDRSSEEHFDQDLPANDRALSRERHNPVGVRRGGGVAAAVHVDQRARARKTTGRDRDLGVDDAGKGRSDQAGAGRSTRGRVVERRGAERGSRGQVGHVEHLGIAFARAVETGAEAIGNRAAVLEVPEVDAGGGDDRVRAGPVGGDQAGARGCVGRGRHDRCGPHVVRRQVEVEVKDLARVLAFAETDLDDFHVVVVLTTEM